MAVDFSGSVYSSGQFTGKVDFDPNEDSLIIESGYGYSSGRNAHVGNIFVHKLICTDTNSAEIVDTICNVAIINNETFTESGTYTQFLTNHKGCDSILVLHLTVLTLEPVIVVNERELSTIESYSSYQWMLNGNIIPGATESAYSVLENGGYQVIVGNEKGCTDTSEIYQVNNAGLGESLVPNIQVYPNPFHEVVNIKSPVPVKAVINSIDGRNIMRIDRAEKISLSALSNGVYYLLIFNEENQLIKKEKIVKQ